jgi:hypothetical protein
VSQRDHSRTGLTGRVGITAAAVRHASPVLEGRLDEPASTARRWVDDGTAVRLRNVPARSAGFISREGDISPTLRSSADAAPAVVPTSQAQDEVAT